MRSRKWLLAAAALAATLAGCAAGTYYGDPYYDGPYNGPYYRDYGYNNNYYGGPGYYVAPPAVSFGFAYSNHDYHGDGHHWH